MFVHGCLRFQLTNLCNVCFSFSFSFLLLQNDWSLTCFVRGNHVYSDSTQMIAVFNWIQKYSLQFTLKNDLSLQWLRTFFESELSTTCLVKEIAEVFKQTASEFQPWKWSKMTKRLKTIGDKKIFYENWHSKLKIYSKKFPVFLLVLCKILFVLKYYYIYYNIITNRMWRHSCKHTWIFRQ